MKIKLTIIATLTPLGLGILAFACAGWYNLSASSPHSGMMKWLLSTTAYASHVGPM